MKIALLFLTRQDLHHPHFWEAILKPHLDKFSVYIHSKNPLKHPFFQPYRIPQIIETTHLIHVKAWQALIQEALKNPAHTHFIFLSESCTPLYPLEVIYQALMQTPDSYMRYSRPWWERDHEREVTELPYEHRWGNAEWAILNRKHAELIAQDHEVIEKISRHPHDQESYPSSLFSLHHCLNEVVYRQTTYASFVHPTGPYPYHFTEMNPLNASYIQNAKRGGCFFARKFTPSFPEDQLYPIMEERLLPFPPESLFSNSLTSQDWQRLKLNVALEELSLSNSCAILAFLIQNMGLEIGCEIGVSSGLHLQRTLMQTTVEKVYAIDPYRPTDLLSQDQQETLFLLAQEWLHPCKHQIEFVRQSSQEAAEQVADQSLDFVFIHGLHIKDPITIELARWLPKVRSDGLIAGYAKTALGPFIAPEVQTFFKEKNLDLQSDSLEPGFWWLVCP